ncbi:MAG: carbamoyltransferase HypF, partial [Peptococcaceae bacterium]|nr:carbamoyltransferase HypF [Peptococcaceae bacterium]
MENIISENVAARQIKVTGIVQGVGFRPFIYRIAKKYSLRGWVLNDSSGVSIHWEGAGINVSRAVEEISRSLPPLARIASIAILKADFSAFRDFTIKESTCSRGTGGLIPADMALCENCLAEFSEHSDRRYLYPFINCTDCGPRYTIIEDIPYDRESTTMAAFEMCPRCNLEYNNPEDRRFHAQPNACPQCGPRISLLNSLGEECSNKTTDIISSGGIVAVKGLGGYHLVCD